MNAIDLAQEIWGDLWEFGRVLLIVLCGLGWQSFRSGRLSNREELSDLGKVILIGLCSTGAFGVFCFLNIQMSNILKLMKLVPLWGTFSGFSLLALVAAVGLIAHQQLGTTGDEINVSILNAAEPSSKLRTSPAVLLIGLGIATLCGLISSWWLWSIAHGRWIT